MPRGFSTRRRSDEEDDPRRFKAKWELIAELFIEGDLDQIFSHQEIEKAADSPITHLGAALKKAIKFHREKTQRGVRNVRGVGYQILHPNEAYSELDVYLGRIVRNVKDGRDVVQHAGVLQMDMEGRDKFNDRRAGLMNFAKAIDDDRRERDYRNETARMQAPKGSRAA